LVLPGETENVETLRDVAAHLEAVALEAALVQSDRAYLTATASRLRALAESLAAVEETAAAPSATGLDETLHRPERTWTRREAARRAKVAPNTLLHMEERGLLNPRRDERGWRVYTKADIDLARTHLHVRLPLPGSE
jgi:hypothetical protein